MKTVVILGATGSIGVHTLNVIEQHSDRFQVIALTAHRNIKLLFQQCMQFKPLYAVVSTQELANELQQYLKSKGLKTIVLFGPQALVDIVCLAEIDIVVAAMVGAAGLLPVLAAIRNKKQILLANKEVLIMAGSFLIEEVKRSQATLLPIDSEHNAIFQCLHGDFVIGNPPKEVSKIILTASGGALRNKSLQQLSETSPIEACQHPTWSMGAKISIDSATLMNKGFEVIEAHFLFGFRLEQIEVVLHPQSIIHSFVEYLDGSLLAQMANPDMRIPISYALAWPERLTNSSAPLDLLQIAQLDFKPINKERYPCFAVALQALKIGGTAPTILNAANEIIVQAFLERKINFNDIAYLNKQVLEKIHSRPATSLEIILEDDNLAREIALEMIRKKYGVGVDVDMMKTQVAIL